MNKSQGPNLKYLQKIEEQEKLIDFLKSKYKESTGFDAPELQNETVQTSIKINPHSISLPNAKSIMFETKSQENITIQSHQTFFDAVSNLKLPTKLLPSKIRQKNNLKTTIDLKNPFHLIEVIDLSGYENKNFNRLAFKEFLEQLQDMRTLHTLKLSHNGIDDSYADELKYIITNTNVKCLDLSNNEIGCKGIEIFFTALKEVTYFKSLNFVKNSFSHNLTSLNQLVQACLHQNDLFQIGIDSFKQGANDYKGSDILLKLVCNHKSLRRITIQDSQIYDLSKLNNLLKLQTCQITELTLKYCFLTKDQIIQLMQALQNNQSLVYLNLQQNGLNDLSGKYIAQMITNNYYLYFIDLEHNQLGNDFINDLSLALKRNNVLQHIRLGYNAISELKQLLNVIGPENDSVSDFGNIQQNPLLLAQADILQKRLKQSKDQSTNYIILKPVNFLQSLHRKQENFRVWNI